MPNDPLPILHIELEGLQYQVRHAFLDRLEEIKCYAIAAIDASLTTLREGALEAAIVRAVDRTLEEALELGIQEAVKEAVTEYFESGPGKEFVLQAILSRLRSEYS